MNHSIWRQTYILALAILSILTSNMYVAAIPVIQKALHTSTHNIQLTISYYMLGLFLGIIIYGPLSDEFGRKRVLLGGLILFAIGVLLSLFSNSIELFSISRMIQALGAASALSLWQALAVDFFQEKAGKVIAAGYMTIGFIPAISPFIGGFLTTTLGWRSIFMLLSIYGIALILLIHFVIKHEAKRSPKPHRAHWLTETIDNYRRLLSSSQFVLLTLFSATLYSTLYVFMAETPSLLHKLGYSTSKIGSFFIPISVAFILGSYSAQHFLKKQAQAKRLILIGIVFSLTGAISQAILNLTGNSTNWIALIAPFSLMTIGTGMMLPIIVSKAMSLFTNNAGISASMIGALQNLIAFLLSAIAATLSQWNVLGLTLSLAFIAIAVTSKGSWITLRRHV